MPIRKHLKDHSAFDPDAIEAMSAALELTCSALHVNGHIRDREAIAARERLNQLIEDLQRSKDALQCGK
jgi:hypothetical protein